jgi:dihydrodipicolinate synthase/N-acetylneuraminate lyase
LMQTEKPPRGLIVDLITPLNDGGDIDERGLSSLLGKLLPYADAVLLAGPQMGEGSGLSFEVKADLLAKASAIIQGKAPIFFWISEKSTDDTKQLLALLEDRLDACDKKGMVFWLDSPLYYHSNRGLYEYYEELTSDSRHPFILYNDPALIMHLERPLKRRNIRTNILKNVSRIEKITALIFQGLLTRANNYQRAVSARPDFRVYDGDETRFLEHPSVSGVLSIGANIAPGIWHTITKASLGRQEEDRMKGDYLNQLFEMGKLLQDLIKIYQKNPVGMLKRVLFDLNIIGSSACTPATEPVKDEIKPLAEFLSIHYIY